MTDEVGQLDRGGWKLSLLNAARAEQRAVQGNRQHVHADHHRERRQDER
jgi:hypothetical protein